MQLRQTRRRRVLSDESTTADLAPEALSGGRAAAGGASGDAKHAPFTPAVKRELERPVVDLLPGRYRAMSLLLITGLAVISGLELLYYSINELKGLLGVDALPCIDLAGQTSMAAWFSSCLLGVTALVALLVYWLRRHRVDDYHGRYRVWLWTVGTLMLLSVNETAELDRLGPALVAPLARRCSMTDATLWDGVAGALLAILVLRQLFEIRRSKLALVTLVAAVSALVCAVGLNHGWLPAAESSRRTMISSGVRMLGHLLLLFAVTVYARHVARHAAGLLPVRAAKKRRPKAAKRERAQADATEKHVAPPQKPQPQMAAMTDLKSASSSAAGQNAAKQPVPAAKPPAQSVARRDDPHEDNPGMTRAERKRLKRQMRQDRE